MNGEVPFLVACMCLAAFGLGAAFILWGWKMTRSEIEQAGRSGEC